jgi:NAD kinase
MISPRDRKIVLVTRKTRYEELLARHHTAARAKFYVEHLGADFVDYQREHDAYKAALRVTTGALEQHGRYQLLERAYLPNFLFGADDIVVALGQDGLVANTMKYLDGQPLVGLNPDPSRYDGILLPFAPTELYGLLPELLTDSRPFKEVTMAKATLTDQQVLHAVNDLFIGPKSHTSARYEIRFRDVAEVQSSSGIIVSTGLGSTAWMRSIVTGSTAIADAVLHEEHRLEFEPLPWNTDHLQFAVREPFPSISSKVGLVFGEIDRDEALRLRSLMPETGVIFSDGIESDFLEFNSGTEAAITVAGKRGRLVV